MPRDRDSAFFGHPIGLMSLFFTEMFERFCYYGMRAFLVFYLAAPHELGGRGMFVIKDGHWVASPHASAMVGIYGSTVYLLSLPGGWIADRFLGQRKAVIIGGIGIMIGNALLAIPNASSLFFVALALMALGTGFLKPNASTIVGQLYKPGDIRRDAGFTIYYIGINIGATIAPILLSFIAGEGIVSESFRTFLKGHGVNPNYCWNVAFAITAVGMLVGVLQFSMSQRLLGEAGKHPNIPTDARVAARDRKILMAIVGALVFVAGLVVVTNASLDTVKNVMSIGFVVGSIIIFYGLHRLARSDEERRGILAMIPLYMGAIAFFGIFEQAPTTLNTFASELTRRDFMGLTIPAAFWQSVNGLFIVILAPLVAAIWIRLAKANKEPSSVMKFSLGMAIMSLSFVVMLPALGATHDAPVSAGFLIGLYLFNTLAELCISPVGLSSMSKLAPARLGGMVMGLWFFGTAIGVFLAGRAGEVSGKWGYGVLFKFLIVSSLVSSAILYVIAPMIKKMMAKNDTAVDVPVEKSALAEPEPLPEARVVSDDKK